VVDARAVLQLLGVSGLEAAGHYCVEIDEDISAETRLVARTDDCCARARETQLDGVVAWLCPSGHESG
jgi:hypothetical protein